MNKKLQQLLIIIIAISISFIFYIDLGISNNQVIQYIILLPVLVIYAFYFFIYKQIKFNSYILLQILFFILIYFLTSIKFGIKFKDIISISGFLIIPIMIMIFSEIKVELKDKLLKYFICFFSFMEILLIILKIINNSFIGFEDLSMIRAIFPSWPNYFSIISVLKLGISIYIYKINSLKRNTFIFLILLSGLVIFLSLSRTGILILSIIILLNIIISVEKLNIETLFVKNKKSTLCSLAVLLLILIIFIIKGSLGNNELFVTIGLRFSIWYDVLPFIKENFLLGIGFRSIFDTIGLIGNKISTHNDYIDILLKSGVIGFLVIYSYFIRRTWMLFKRNYYEFSSLIIAIFVAGLFQNPLKNLSIMIIFSLLLSYSYKEVH